MNSKIFSSYGLPALAGLAAGLFMVSGAAAATPIYGWAWSDNIGWVSLNCEDLSGSCAGSNYAVILNDDGTLSGYAWGPNIGWIRFDPAGPYPEAPQVSARLQGDSFIGWFRALNGALNSNDGWSGWLKMINVVRFRNADEDFDRINGYAWGPLVGWLQFDATIGVQDNNPPGGGMSASCTTDHSSGAAAGETIEWRVNGNGGTEPYSYCWGNVCSPALGGNVHGGSQIVNTVMGTADQTGMARVIDDVGETAECQTTVSYLPASQHVLGVTVSDLGTGYGLVTSDDGLINCRSTSGSCTTNYPDGDQVLLTATGGSNPTPGADETWVFYSWGGGCQGTDNPCLVTMDADRNVQANFRCVGADCAVGDLELVLETWPIRILFHLPGDWSVRATNVEDGPGQIRALGEVYNVRLESIVSTQNGCDIFEIAAGTCGVPLGTPSVDGPVCALKSGSTLPDFGEFSESVCRGQNGLGVLGDGETASFSLMMRDRRERFRELSPYEVTFIGDGGVNVSGVFEYRPSGISEY